MEHETGPGKHGPCMEHVHTYNPGYMLNFDAVDHADELMLHRSLSCARVSPSCQDTAYVDHRSTTKHTGMHAWVHNATRRCVTLECDKIEP